MKQKYEPEPINKLLKDYADNKISYNEYVRQLCILYVGEDNFDFYDLIEHDLYIYCTDESVIIIKNFY